MDWTLLHYYSFLDFKVSMMIDIPSETYRCYNDNNDEIITRSNPMSYSISLESTLSPVWQLFEPSIGSRAFRKLCASSLKALNRQSQYHLWLHPLGLPPLLIIGRKSRQLEPRKCLEYSKRSIVNAAINWFIRSIRGKFVTRNDFENDGNSSWIVDHSSCW